MRDGVTSAADLPSAVEAIMNNDHYADADGFCPTCTRRGVGDNQKPVPFPPGIGCGVYDATRTIARRNAERLDPGFPFLALVEPEADPPVGPAGDDENGAAPLPHPATGEEGTRPRTTRKRSRSG